jgi:acyl-CoA thioester hydrolase
MGVAYYANYLVWFEVGRNHHFRHIGLPYREVEARGIYLPVSEVRCRILVSARYDDEIAIHTRIQEVRSRKIVLGYHIDRDKTRVAEGETTHICLSGDQRVTVMPEWMRAKLLP